MQDTCQSPAQAAVGVMELARLGAALGVTSDSNPTPILSVLIRALVSCNRVDA